MVDKNLDLVKEVIFADVQESYPNPELEQVYDEFFEEGNFDKPDVLLLTGGPNKREEQQRAESLIQYLDEFEREDVPVVVTTPSQKERLDEHTEITDSDYIFHRMDPKSSADEVEALMSEVEDDSNVVVFTNDYHVPRYEKMLDSSIDNSVDYLVYGADLGSSYEEKWRSELIRTVLPQDLKDLGKKYLR